MVTVPRSAVRHRPIAPDVEEVAVLTQRASKKGKQQREPHTTGGPPSLDKKQQRWHPLVFAGVGMIVATFLFLLGQQVVSWGTIASDNLRYGYPRTTQVDHYVGHEVARVPSHFTAMNIRGQIYVLEIPGGNPQATHLLIGPHLVGPGVDLAPIALAFVGDPHHPDLLVTVRGIQTRFHNTGRSYVLAAG